LALIVQRALLLEAWKSFEEQNGSEAQIAHVQEMMPTTRKRWRKAEDGSGTLEEYWDIAFPDDERDANPTTFKFFQAAQNWAAKKSAGAGGLSYDMPSDSEDEEDGNGAGDEEDDEDGGTGSGEAAAGGEPMDEDE
jgi:crooked neck